MPPSRSAVAASPSAMSDTFPPIGTAPSATTTMLNRAPNFSRSRRRAATIFRSKGISGIRITSAPPATPAYSAIHPAYRPITSTTMTRWCASAVLCSRSMASVAKFTAVSNPKQLTVPTMSLSMVFGTPTMGMPFFENSCAIAERAVAADDDERVEAELVKVLDDARRVVDLSVARRHGIGERVAAIGGAENRAAEAQNAGDVLGHQARARGPAR